MVCHFSKRHQGTRIHSWESFCEDYKEGNGKITRYHPIIPFKHHEKIIKQIAWAVDVDFRKNRYCIANRNCEHLANMIVYGINYSEQVKKGPIKSWIGTRNFNVINNGKGSAIKLTNEMSESDRELRLKTDERSEQIESLIEIPPKEICRTM